MIITSTHIDGREILLAGHNKDDNVQLTLITWLVGDNWQDAASVVKIKNHDNLNDKDIVFIEENSLSSNDINNNPIEALLLAAIAQLNQFVSGTRQTFSLPLDTTTGTPFQQKVWQALQDIGYGETISYAKLAENISQPKAFRAVASANGQNPFSIVIPCHRVIASGGGLGGYTGGLDKKEWLLAIEKHK